MIVERTPCLLASLASLVACGSRLPESALPATADRDHVEEFADQDDLCPYLPAACLEGFDFRDDDGCPDPLPPVFSVPAGAVTIPDDASGELDRVATDARRLAAGATLVLIVATAPGEADAETARRAALVTSALVHRGTPADRIRIEVVRVLPPADRVVIGVDGCQLGLGLSDADGDRIPDHRDACPEEPEDLDGYLDGDGCPDFDHDCQPVDPEADDGSCGDRDHDGVPDAEDRCPDQPGPGSNAGCPRPRVGPA